MANEVKTTKSTTALNTTISGCETNFAAVKVAQINNKTYLAEVVDTEKGIKLNSAMEIDSGITALTFKRYIAKSTTGELRNISANSATGVTVEDLTAEQLLMADEALAKARQIAQNMLGKIFEQNLCR